MISLNTVHILLVIVFIFATAFGENAEYATEGDCSLGLVDAATRTEDGSSYLFRGNYYWKIVTGGIANGFPRLISEGWPGVENGSIDAALTWNDGSTFIFKGDQYWKFFNTRPEIGYPKKIKDGFGGIPDNLDAALVWENNAVTYFFQGDKYWRYDPRASIPTNGNYPANISAWVGVPNDVTAAIRWDGGLTYFFKGSEYYKYDNKAEKVPKNYPASTAKAWFECNNNSTKPSISYEREDNSRNKREITNLFKKMDTLTNLLVEIYLMQKRSQSTVNDIKVYTKETRFLLGDVSQEIPENNHVDLLTTVQGHVNGVL